jgi:predicted SAM-dependent methyltransferase
MTGISSFGHIYKNLKSDIPQIAVEKFYPAVTGALFAISRRCMNAVGKFNEEFFVACEDVEYCLRVWQSGFKVLYSPDVEAIHIEGYTRGHNDATKLIKGAEWMRKEKEGIKRFEKILKRFDLHGIENDVAKGNRSKVDPNRVLKKIEIGCGNNPQPGFIHLDIRKLPHVDIVCDFEHSRLPFRDCEVDEIISNHVIEHISWRNLPFVLKEWNRVLSVGGRVFLRTPDLEFICKTYLAKKTTPEWPGDENYIKENLSKEITPAWWANIKLFAGQDYPSNFHKLCFDFKMLKDLFERNGFTNVTRLNIQPIYSPGEIQMECFKL